MTPRWRRPPGPPTSMLLADTWDVPTLGLVTLDVPRLDELRAIDELWSKGRAADDAATHWRWRDIALDSPDRFCVRADSGAVLALWASSKARPIAIGAAAFAYRMDWLEVAPSARRTGLGTFTMALVAARALERRATVVVYGALDRDDVLAFHLDLGAERGAPPGWRAPPDLVPFTIPAAKVIELAARAHDRRK